jgi:SAM-dependent methyltransferase
VTPAIRAHERQFGQPGIFSYGRCPECQALVLLNPPADLGAYYSGSYYSFSGELPARSLKRRFIGLVSGNLGAVVRWVPDKRSRILDVGCGSGHLVQELAACGYENVEGIDPFLDESKPLNSRVKLRRACIEEVSTRYDAILYNHVLEHVADPLAELAAATERLSPGGKIIIRVPLADSFLFRSAQANWYQLDAPRHLWIPSRAAVKTLVAQLGLRLVKIQEDATVAARLFSYLLAKNDRLPPGLMRKYKSPLYAPLIFWSHLQTAFARLCKKGDQACFVVEKSR